MYFFPKTNKRAGFTLIELLMVISIISLMSSIVLASLSQAGKKSRDATRILDIKQLRNAIELYININGHAPFLTNCDQESPSFEFDCKAYSNDAQGNTTASWLVLGTQLSPFLKTMPTDNLGRSNPSTDPILYRYIYHAPGYLKVICDRALGLGTVSTCDTGDSDYSITAESFESTDAKYGFATIDPFGSF